MQQVRLVLVTMLLVGFGTAMAVPPAYTGQFGNPEEPALRPYKWLWRGVKALTYQTANAAKEGNLKTPILGSVETFRGFRKGIVEFDESVFRGMLGAVPPQAGNRDLEYRWLLSANQFIESDALLRNVADYVATAYAVGIITGANGVIEDDFSRYISPFKLTGTAASFPHSGSEPLFTAAYIWAGMKVVDYAPVQPNWREIDERAEVLRRERRALRQARDVESRLFTPRQRAQRRYVGDRILILPRDPYARDLRRLRLPE
jgi:hypothetical protein